MKEQLNWWRIPQRWQLILLNYTPYLKRLLRTWYINLEYWNVYTFENWNHYAINHAIFLSTERLVSHLLWSDDIFGSPLALLSVCAAGLDPAMIPACCSGTCGSPVLPLDTGPSKGSCEHIDVSSAVYCLEYKRTRVSTPSNRHTLPYKRDKMKILKPKLKLLRCMVTNDNMLLWWRINLIPFFYLLCPSKRKHLNLRLQGGILQCFSSRSVPSHVWVNSLPGSGASQRRVLIIFPRPHVTEHGLKSPQHDHSPARISSVEITFFPIQWSC